MNRTHANDKCQSIEDIFKEDFAFNNRWKIVHQIGQGSHGIVFKAVDIRTGLEVAVKVGIPVALKQNLKLEHSFYHHIMRCAEPGKIIEVPNVYFYGQIENHEYMVLEMVGPTLENLYFFQNCHFRLKTIMMLFKAILKAIKQVHLCGIVHRDLKPTNICMGRGNQAQQVHLIDFSIAGACHMDNEKAPYFQGCTKYAPLSMHCGRPYGPKDDLESICYVMMYLHKGDLPWICDDDVTMKELMEYAKEWKSQSTDDICAAYPRFFKDCLDYLRTLSFSDSPNYSYMIGIIDKVMGKVNYRDDKIFDWFRKPDGGFIDVCEETANRLNDQVIEFERTRRSSGSSGALRDGIYGPENHTQSKHKLFESCSTSQKLEEWGSSRESTSKLSFELQRFRLSISNKQHFNSNANEQPTRISENNHMTWEEQKMRTNRYKGAMKILRNIFGKQHREGQ